MRVRDTGVDEYRVTIAGIERRTISRVNGNIRVDCEILLSSSRQARIHLTGRHSPARSNHFGHDCSVIANAAAQVVNAVAGLERECNDLTGHRSWLPIV